MLGQQKLPNWNAKKQKEKKKTTTEYNIQQM